MPNSRSDKAAKRERRQKPTSSDERPAVKLRRETARLQAEPEAPPLPQAGASALLDGLRKMLDAEMTRQAESAAMLIAVTRLLLNLGGREYAAWLRSVADDFEATDAATETADDVAKDLLRLSRSAAAKDASSPLNRPDGVVPDAPVVKARRPRHH